MMGIWHFERVRARLSCPEIEPANGHIRHCYYAMPFYTSKYGYKVGLAAKVDTRYEQDHDTLCDVQGGYDTLLAWPVRFTVKLTLTAPRGSKQASILSSINVFKMIPNNSEVPETYQFPMLVSLDQMSEFAVNDSFYFKCITTVHQEVDRFAAQSSLSCILYCRVL